MNAGPIATAWSVDKDTIRRLDDRNLALRQALWEVYKMHGGISTAPTPDGISDYDLIGMATNHANQQGPAC